MHEIKILLIEDNEGDIVLTREALHDARVKNQVIIARDGAEAIELLSSSTEEDLPDLIFLDINLPKVDGKEVLHYIKNHDTLRRIPVVMLTTSSSQTDIQDAYNNHANCYITKPVDLDKFFEVVKMIEDFWISIVKLPTKK